MRNALFTIVSLIALTLTGCGSSSSQSPTSTPPPIIITPPPILPQSYDGVILDHQGTFALQSNTIVEYHQDTDTVVFQTIKGAVNAGPSRRVTINGIVYAINFAPASHLLIIGDVMSPTDYASWTITLIASNG